MQKQKIIWNTESAIEIAIQPENISLFRQIAEAETRHGKIRVALPALPPRQSCRARRALIAALREAEFAAWMASGGDFLNSMHQRVP